MRVIAEQEEAAAAPASWLSIGSLSVGAFALVTSEFLPVGLLPTIAEDLHITHGQAGLMVTLPGILAALAAPLTIMFAGHMDRRRLLWLLLALLAGSNLMVAMATGLTQLLFGRVLLGLAVGSFWTIAGSLGPRLRPGPEGVKASALILSGVSLGTVAGVPAGSLIGELFSWQAAFLAASVFAVIAGLAVVRLLPSIPAVEGAGLGQIPPIIRDREARVRLAASVMIFIGQFAAYTYVAPFLSQHSGISGGMLSALLLANGIAGFFGNMAGGWLSGRDPRSAINVTAGLLGLSVLLLALVGWLPLVAALLVVIWGFAFGMLPISMQSWLFGAVPSRIEGMQALFVVVAQAAIGSGALLGGLIVDHAGVIGALVTGGVAALLTLLVAGASQEPAPSQERLADCSA